MSDINFLPHELRKKEERELKKKNSQDTGQIVYHRPLEDAREPAQAHAMKDALKAIKSLVASRREPPIASVPSASASSLQAGLKKEEKSLVRKKIESTVPQISKTAFRAPTQISKPEKAIESMALLDPKVTPQVKPEKQKPSKKNEEASWWRRLLKKKNFSPSVRIISEAPSYKTTKQTVAAEAKNDPILIPEPKEAKLAKEAGEKKDTSELGSEEKDASRIEVNLLPEEEALRSRIVKRLYALAVSGAVMILFVSLAWLSVSARGQRADEKIALQEAEMANREKELVTLERELEDREQDLVRLAALGRLIDQQHRWTVFFSRVESRMDEDVALESMEIIGDRVRTEIVAPSWEKAARQLALFEETKDWWTVQNASGASLTGGANAEKAEDSASEEGEESSTSEVSTVQFSIEMLINAALWQEAP